MVEVSEALVILEVLIEIVNVMESKVVKMSSGGTRGT